MTTLKNFDTDLDTNGVSRIVKTTPPAAVRSTVTVTQKVNEHHTYEGKSEAEWGWSEFRDFVVDQITRANGPFPRMAEREAGIFKRFLSQYGIADAMAITRYAFEVCGGRWGNAPIGITRYCKGSDPYFAQPILERIRGER
jgi:hypothetical protein